MFLAPACIPSCPMDQACVNGICINLGNLAITLTWSYAGDADLVVTTPNNKTIYHRNRNASIATDFGALDIDVQNGTGPESIYWNSSIQPPPNGTYHVCFQQYGFNATALLPITAKIEIRIPNQATQVHTKTFNRNSYPLPDWCNPILYSFVVSFNYP